MAEKTSKKNHKFRVKVLVPRKLTKKMKKTRKGQKLKFSDLPSDLMESMVEGLSSADRIRFGATCKKNLTFVATQQPPHQYQFRTIDKLPWMATFLAGFVERGLMFRLFEPQQQRGQPNYADYQIRDPNGQGLDHTTIKACKKGWFLCLWPKGGESGEEEDMTSFLLFCPFNKRIIKLPELDHDLDCKNFLGDHLTCQATFSSDDPSSPDCVFFFLSQESSPGKYKISTLEDQKSGKWNTKLFDKLIDDVSSVVYHEGCFYCLSSQAELAAYDVVQHTWNLIISPSPLSNLHSRMPQIGLVVCQGRLIIAFVDLANSEYNNLGAFRCGLFEFSSSTSTWVEKTSLADHALFLRGPTSFTVSVPSRSNVADRMYFCSYRMDKACPIYYSFKDGRCHMSENGDYWSGVERGMWIEPLPTF